jgi:TPR repeat protein
MYLHGQGVPQDYAEAVRWFRKAAEQGLASAQSNLGAMYHEGQGVVQDYAEAIRWFREAAEQGDAAAQFNLGNMYHDGKGVPQDYVQAHMWVNLAASRSSGDDQKKYATARDFLAGKMTAQQIAEAQRLARDWTPKIAKPH